MKPHPDADVNLARKHALRAYRVFRRQHFSPYSAMEAVHSNSRLTSVQLHSHVRVPLNEDHRARPHYGFVADEYLQRVKDHILSDAPSNVYWYNGKLREDTHVQSEASQPEEKEDTQ